MSTWGNMSKADLIRQIKQLEEIVRVLRIENERKTFRSGIERKLAEYVLKTVSPVEFVKILVEETEAPNGTKQ